MLMLGSRLHGTAVMSLQTGTRLGQVTQPLINPADLKILAYAVEGPLITENPAFIRIADIREMGHLGMIVDSNDELIGLDDVIQIKKIHDLNFKLIGLNVIDETKRKLGKIEDFTVETGSFIIQQLTVKRGILKGLTDTGFLVHRSQIVEINDREIIVKTTAKKIHEPVMQAIRRDYVNPFRTQNPQVEQREG